MTDRRLLMKNMMMAPLLAKGAQDPRVESPLWAIGELKEAVLAPSPWRPSLPPLRLVLPDWLPPAPAAPGGLFLSPAGVFEDGEAV